MSSGLVVSLVFSQLLSCRWYCGIYVDLVNFSGFGVRTFSTLRPRNGQSRRKMTINVPSVCMCWIPFTR